MQQTGFIAIDLVLSLVFKAIALIEGIMGQWVNVFYLKDTGDAYGSLSTAGNALVAEVSDIVEKILQLVEGLLDGLGASPY